VFKRTWTNEGDVCVREEGGQEDNCIGALNLHVDILVLPLLRERGQPSPRIGVFVICFEICPEKLQGWSKFWVVYGSLLTILSAAHFFVNSHFPNSKTIGDDHRIAIESTDSAVLNTVSNLIIGSLQRAYVCAKD
jgi:hypothetical protein